MLYHGEMGEDASLHQAIRPHGHMQTLTSDSRLDKGSFGGYNLLVIVQRVSSEQEHIEPRFVSAQLSTLAVVKTCEPRACGCDMRGWGVDRAHCAAWCGPAGLGPEVRRR